MYVICDIGNIVRAYGEIARYVKAQPNGVTVLAKTAREATAIYIEDDRSFWPTREVIAGQPTYTMYQVETVPEEAEIGITRYNTGSLEIDPDLKAEKEAKAEAEEKAIRVAEQSAALARMVAEQQTDEEAILMLADLYEPWAADRSYKKDKILAYGKDALGDTQLYKVIQDHKSQADWTPDKAPSLYTTIGMAENGIPMWRQPTAAFDAYNTGDQCVCDGYVWTSKIDGNTTRPGSDDRWWTKGEAVGGEDPGPEPEPGDVPDWDKVETGYQFKAGTQFIYQGKTYDVIRDMTKTPGWEPPALLGDYYEEA